VPKENYVVLWPAYFDLRCSRKNGRMVERKFAIDGPTTDEILRAVESLGYVKKREEGAFPRYWWNRTGKIVVERKTCKSDLIKKVARKLKTARESSPSQPGQAARQH
jgi:signal recognition particle subunit SRP19